MKRRTRIYYTPEQKAIIWDRYKQGGFLHDIARMFDRYHSSIMPTISRSDVCIAASFHQKHSQQVLVGSKLEVVHRRAQ